MADLLKPLARTFSASSSGGETDGPDLKRHRSGFPLDEISPPSHDEVVTMMKAIAAVQDMFAEARHVANGFTLSYFRSWFQLLNLHLVQSCPYSDLRVSHL
jgi:hypothetical protein